MAESAATETVQESGTETVQESGIVEVRGGSGGGAILKSGLRGWKAGPAEAGKLAATYERQKGQCFARFKVDTGDAGRIGSSQFTIYDFITNSFLFSPAKKQLSIRLLEQVAAGPKPFNELEENLKARKSTLYLLCLSLERSGFIAKAADRKYSLSSGFAGALREYASWWENWVDKNGQKDGQNATLK